MYHIFIIRLTRKKIKKPVSISARNSLSAGRAVCNSVCRLQRAGPQEVKAEVGDGGGVRSPAASAAPRDTCHVPQTKVEMDKFHQKNSAGILFEMEFSFSLKFSR